MSYKGIRYEGSIVGKLEVIQKRRISNDADRVKSFFKFFLLLLTGFAHTSSSTHELHLFLLLPFICVTLTCPSPFTFINSVFPTKHLFDHHRP